MSRFRSVTVADLKTRLEELVWWQMGIDDAWTCDCIVSAALFEQLVRLAAKAPHFYKAKFLDDLGEANDNG